MLDKKQSSKAFYCAYSGLLILSTIFYFVLIGGKNIWMDEAYSMVMIRNTYVDICRITAADVHPPLYYIILKFITSPFGYNNLFVAKIVSIIPYIFIIAFGGIHLKKLFSNKSGLLFMGLFFLFPFSLGYVIEIRMYSFAAACVFANAVYAYRCFIDNKKVNWVLFVLFGLLAAYTHYFALVSVGITYLLLLISLIIKKISLRKWGISATVTVVLYLPWLKCLIKQIKTVSNGYWIESITFRTIIEYGISMFSAAGVRKFALISLMTYAVVFIYLFIRKNKSDFYLSLCMLIVPFGTIFVGVAVSILMRPVFIIRYVIPAVPILVAYMAFGISKMKKKILISVLLIVSVIGGVSQYYVTFINEYSKVENAFDKNFVKKYNTADCYIIEYYNYSQLINFYDWEKPIYDTEYWDACPCKKYFSIEDFAKENNDNVIIVMESGKELNETYTELYDCEYLGEYNLGGNSVDIYNCT